MELSRCFCKQWEEEKKHGEITLLASSTLNSIEKIISKQDRYILILVMKNSI